MKDLIFNTLTNVSNITQTVNILSTQIYIQSVCAKMHARMRKAPESNDIKIPGKFPESQVLNRRHFRGTSFQS